MNRKMKHSGSMTFRLHESSIVDSILDSTTARLPNSLCEDSLASILMAQSANDHIRIIREIIQSTKEIKTKLRQNIQDLKLNINNLEHSQQRDILNLEYELTVNINQFKSTLFQQISDQREQNTQFNQSIINLQQESDDIQYQNEKLEQKLNQMCKQTGQYQYIDYEIE